MTATKKEAQAALNAARTKAQKALEAYGAVAPMEKVEGDARWGYYNRCVREYEEAINDFARFDTSSDDES